jgi:hypothetical protein
VQGLVLWPTPYAYITRYETFLLNPCFSALFLINKCEYMNWSVQADQFKQTAFFLSLAICQAKFSGLSFGPGSVTDEYGALMELWESKPKYADWETNLPKYHFFPHGLLRIYSSCMISRPFCRFVTVCEETNYWNYYWKTTYCLLTRLNTMQQTCRRFLHVDMKTYNVLTAPTPKQDRSFSLQAMLFSPQLREQQPLNKADEIILLIVRIIKLF